MSPREQGQATVETVVLGVLLLVPLLWLLAVLSDVHRAALAASAAAREAGFEAARSDDARAAQAAVDRAVANAFADNGLEPSGARVRWTGGPALERGAAVEVMVSYPVTLARLPLLGGAGPRLWIRAAHVARVDPFASRE